MFSSFRLPKLQSPTDEIISLVEENIFSQGIFPLDYDPRGYGPSIFFLGEGVLIWPRYRAHLAAFGCVIYLIIVFWLVSVAYQARLVSP